LAGFKPNSSSTRFYFFGSWLQRRNEKKCNRTTLNLQIDNKTIEAGKMIILRRKKLVAIFLINISYET
jgi:hypothetical protein